MIPFCRKRFYQIQHRVGALDDEHEISSRQSPFAVGISIRRLNIAYQYPHLVEGCDMKGISKPQIEKVDFHLKWISREEWNINFYRL